jgi:pilus assembly protein CpaE
MFVQINSVVVDADSDYRQEMVQFLSGYGVNVVSQFSEPDQLPSVVGRAGGPHLVMVNLDPNPHQTLRKIAHLPRQYPQVSFFVMSQTVDASLLMQSMQYGVREFIPLPINEENFSAALDRVANQHGMGKKARLLHFIPTQGGCGSTTVACNVAAALAKTGAKTVLLDMDLVRGGVASYFDIRPRFTIADVMESTDKLDKTLLDNALAIHQSSGLAILARPDLPEDTQRVKPNAFSRLLNVFARIFDYVVIDSMMSIDPLYATAVQTADVNILVMQLNVPSAKNAERFVGMLRRMAIDSHKIKIVANRFVKRSLDIDPAEVERTLGLKISHYIPNDFKTAINAINMGEPFVLNAPKAEISQSIKEFSELFLQSKEAARAEAA